MKYTEEQIQALSTIQAMRLKLGMYVGSTATPNHIVTEILANAIDELAGGYGDCVEVHLTKDGAAKVVDHGRGIPFNEHPKLKMSTLDVVFTKEHAGGKMSADNTGYKTSIGTHGVGCTIATATCEKLIVDVWREGKHATRVYSRGTTVGNLKIVKSELKPDQTGTTVTYYPDPTDGLWDSIEFDGSKVKQVMKGFSYFFPGARLHFYDERKTPVEHVEFYAKNGILDMYKDIAGEDDGSLVTKEPIRIQAQIHDIPNALDIVFGYTNGYYDRTTGYCNALRLSDGGTHIQGFKMALTKSLNDAARNLQILKPKDQNFKGQELTEGLVAIVSIKLSEPKFENQTKTRLSNNDLVGTVNSICYEFLKNYFEDNPKVVIAITDKLVQMRKAREAAKKAREMVLNDKQNKSTFANSLIGKLANCTSRDTDKNEVILVEGKSAGGNVKQARDSKTQAVYALRGKVLNVEKVDMNQAFKNQEIKDLISILGCGILEDFDINKLKYGKIVIMTDSDSDVY